jgi:hypothetical protein
MSILQASFLDEFDFENIDIENAFILHNVLDYNH